MKKIFLLAGLACLQVCMLHAQSWKLTGNSATNPATNFIGTTDVQPLIFKVNNQRAGFLSQSSTNSSFGYQALNSITSGINNTAVGYKALLSNKTGLNNTAIGNNSLSNNDIGFSNTAIGGDVLTNSKGGNFNTAIGQQSMHSNISGSSNTAVGAGALVFNTIGYSNAAVGISSLDRNLSGYYNTAAGGYSMHDNVDGYANTANGYMSLYSNTAGYSNIAVGIKALYSNSKGHNLVAVGDSALYNYTGSSGYNTAIGSKTLYNNTGTNNTATGYQALYNNTTGFYNTASGYYSLRSNTTGVFNTAIGTTSLYSNTGSYNTAVGSSSDVNPGLTNATAIGFGALATASNQVWLGNTSVTSVKAGNNIVIVSDGRFKKNLKENVPGLDFINQLKPVTYNYDIHKLNDYMRPAKNNAADEMQPDVNDKAADEAITKKEKIIYTGFVAQEVEKTAEKLGYDFSGVYKPQNDKDPYGLSYSDFVVPLVKAVQELSKKNDEKDALIEQLITRIDKLEQSSKSSLNTSATGGEMQQLINSNTAQLEQNAPNPFSSSTTIRYRIPSTASTAQVTVANASGITVKTFTLNGKGAGTVSINAGELSAGSYFYSLFVDGKKADSRQMILVK
ncbi:MAG TPA: tail fiber domain-containing protein [Panacibacter sp.]|nr:tail fiber domain-containing protein [Panacibacter sp.]